MASFPKKEIFTMQVAAVTLKQIPTIIIRLLDQHNGKKTFFYINAHCVNLSQKNTAYRNVLHNASIVYSGGYGPVFASKIVGRPLLERTPTPDFINEVFAACQKKRWSVYFLGAKKAVVDQLAKNLHRQYPQLIISGYHDGYFSKAQEEKIITEINGRKPTLLIVGMGSPKQELWIAEHSSEINAEAFWAVGALFDVLSGQVPRAPKWMQRNHLEWLFRFLLEPKRLLKRYTLGNISFLFLIAKARFKVRTQLE